MDYLNNDICLIEFNGLPGCGKTTTVDELIKIFQSVQVNAATLDDVYFYKEKNKFSKLITLLLAVFSIKEFNINFSIIRYFLKFNFTIERFIYMLRLIKVYYQIRKVMMSGSYNVIILEEGIIQYIASISHIDNIKDEDMLKELVEKIFRKFRRVLCVNCELDISEVIKRIRQRNLCNRRFDIMADEDLYNGLLANKVAFEIMKKSNHGKEQVEIHMVDSPDFNANKIFEKYCKYISNDDNNNTIQRRYN